MVNKCSVPGCKSLYMKDNVKLHRFPLTNTETLPFWIATTGRGEDWKPGKSSRLCGHHFRESEYIVGHGKGILKSTAIPTIEYRTDNPRYLKHCTSLCDNMGHMKNLKESMDTDINVEIVQLNCNDIYDSKHEHKDNNGNSCDNHGVPPYNTKEYVEDQNNKEIMKNNKHHTSANTDDDHNYNNEENNNSNDETIKNDPENFNCDTKNDICNRENQCYMFTSSFKEGAEPIVLIPPDDKPFEGPSNMEYNQLTADSNFNQIMALKLQRQRRTRDIYSLYFKSLKKKNEYKQDRNIHSFNDDAASFGAFIEAQMKELRPHRKLYLSTKHKIQKLIMKAQLKMEN